MYWKLLKHVSPFELLANRIVWGFVCVFPLLCGRDRRNELRRILFVDVRSGAMLVAASLLIGWNWYNFVVAMVTDRVLESSLAYFLTPLMVIIVGVMLLGESLNRSQKVSLNLAGVGMLFLLFWMGRPPWLALILSSTFAFYGYFKTRVSASGTVGVGVENALLAIPAVWYLFKIAPTHNWSTWLLLMVSGPLTILPMVGYARVVKAIPFSTVGFLQYLSPGLQFVLAVFVYRERFGVGHCVAFGFTWLALIVFTRDLFVRFRAPVKASL